MINFVIGLGIGLAAGGTIVWLWMRRYKAKVIAYAQKEVLRIDKALRKAGGG